MATTQMEFTFDIAVSRTQAQVVWSDGDLSYTATARNGDDGILDVNTLRINTYRGETPRPDARFEQRLTGTMFSLVIDVLREHYDGETERKWSVTMPPAF